MEKQKNTTDISKYFKQLKKATLNAFYFLFILKLYSANVKDNTKTVFYVFVCLHFQNVKQSSFYFAGKPQGPFKAFLDNSWFISWKMVGT